MTQAAESPFSHPERSQTEQPLRSLGWKLEDAKAKFSEVVRKARSEGPQRVSVRGEDAVVVVAADEFDRLHSHVADRLPFVAFMETLASEGLDLTRDSDTGRDMVL
jgi:prevent-host-death family protein